MSELARIWPEKRELLYLAAFPGGLSLAIAGLLLATGILPASNYSFLQFYFDAVFAMGVLLALRFHSSRTLFGLLTLAIAIQAPHPPAAPAYAAVVAFVLPLMLAIFALWPESGFSLVAVAPRFVALLAGCAFVAALSRSEVADIAASFKAHLVPAAWTAWCRVPQPAMLAFLGAVMAIAVLFAIRCKTIEAGFFWSVASCGIAMQLGMARPISRAFLITAGLVLVISLVENSYRLAYHDELTGLPARRALNEAMHSLDAKFSVAMVDVDHFKKFNDTFGHDTGDQVLRMVAARLGGVNGGGRAFRIGGEEFVLLFPGIPLRDAYPHLEEVRKRIEDSKFVVRGPDRKQRSAQDRQFTGTRASSLTAKEVCVTVSIGAAEPHASGESLEHVMRLADKALYKAKKTGRNRTEMAGVRASARKSASTGGSSQMV
ncbi:MAG TPA: GGDEF domain-containing protein [Terriglobales bacterium]|nr:GGDEF domain-containing protein [Terriglobales bacterium]